MPTEITYNSLLQQYNQTDASLKNVDGVVDSIPNTNPNPTTAGTPLPTDEYTLSALAAPRQGLEDLLGIKNGTNEIVNNYRGGSQVLINSDRIILNSRTDFTMICGAKGVSISSIADVNIDADEAVTLYGDRGLFLGVPGKGKGLDEGGGVTKVPKTKAEATLDEDYEPMVLGQKLVNLLEDLLITIKNATVITSTGKAYFREDTLYELACLQARLPEMLSTYGYIDGISHEVPDPAPEPPASLSTPSDLVVGTTAGPTSNIGLGTQQTNATTGDGGPLEGYPDYFESNDPNF